MNIETIGQRDQTMNRLDAQLFVGEFDDERHNCIVADIENAIGSPFHAVFDPRLETMMSIGEHHGRRSNGRCDGVLLRGVIDRVQAMLDPQLVDTVRDFVALIDERSQAFSQRQTPDRIDVRASGAQQIEPVGFRLGHRALVGENVAFAGNVGKCECSEHTNGVARFAVWASELHPVAVEARAGIDNERAISLPCAQRRRGALVSVAFGVFVLRQDEADRVVCVECFEPDAFMIVHHVVGGRGDLRDIAALCISSAGKRNEIRHFLGLPQESGCSGTDSYRYGMSLVIGCDLDGVIWRGSEVIPGSVEAIAQLQNDGAIVVFITNNSSTTPSQYVEKLAGFGITTTAEMIITSALAAAHLASEHLDAGSTVLACAGPGVVEALTERGFAVHNDGPADAVVVGWHQSFDFERLRIAADCARSGALFIATNDDPTYPGAAGSLLPGNGSLVAAVATASGCTPFVAGKPHEAMARLVRMKVGPAGIMVGDRVSTDGAFAARLGWPFGLVLSGIAGTDRGELVADSGAQWIANDLQTLVPLLLKSDPAVAGS